ncbi:PAS domain-containing sensor histidine kinase [Rhodopirellula halodulae]|uniref:PAS domain-containing sensor histidine kinase n=1 Tax=Rhodopirellula halodulae TaxID=2894198 RepID=UPI001E2F1159|nr:ATP-binding protein [Rhodopirellula sp. JC737]MCC9658698.1 PAS domain S-box protein [Rhodopirellula sp. JC737]
MTQTDQQANSTPRRGDPIAARFFRAIAESTVDWESWHSATGEVLWVNKAVTRFTGFSPEECLAMEDYPLPVVAEEDRPLLADSMKGAMLGTTRNNVEFRVQHRDGTSKWMAISWQPMIDEHGVAFGFRTSVRDVTERRQMREMLRLQNLHLEQLVEERTAKIAQLEQHRLRMEKVAALGELAAGVAHEINNPLAGIRNAFALLKRHLPKDVKHHDKLDLIDAEIERIRGITHQMYQLYGPSQQTPRTFDLERMMAEVASLTHPMARKARVKIQWDTPKLPADCGLGQGEVCLREGEVKQILLNLIHNAIQASSTGQCVRVAAAEVGRQIELQVSDDGVGMDREVIARIFEPFFSTKTATVGQGMGLGLSVTRGLVEAMHGNIHVDSSSGKGTTFVVRLPRKMDLDVGSDQ